MGRKNSIRALRGKKKRGAHFARRKLILTI